MDIPAADRYVTVYRRCGVERKVSSYWSNCSIRRRDHEDGNLSHLAARFYHLGRIQTSPVREWGPREESIY